MKKLDRFLISSNWDDLFPDVIQMTIPNPCSDHPPIKLLFIGLLRGIKAPSNLIMLENAIVNLVRRIKVTRYAI